MYKITCDYCFEDNFFEDADNRPEHCSNCNSPLDHLEITDADEKTDLDEESKKRKVLDGLTLIYQKTSKKIEVPHSEIIIIGRQNVGGQVFASIPQISREHCKIEYIDNHYVITDLDSLNGTYLGINKRDCRKHIQVKIKDNDNIYLGREPFLVKLKYKIVDEHEAVEIDENFEYLKTKKFKCRACGKIHEMNLLICDSCGSYGQVEPIED